MEILTSFPGDTSVDSLLVLGIFVAVDLKEPLLFRVDKDYRDERPSYEECKCHKEVAPDKGYSRYGEPEAGIHGVTYPSVDTVCLKLVVPDVIIHSREDGTYIPYRYARNSENYSREAEEPRPYTFKDAYLIYMRSEVKYYCIEKRYASDKPRTYAEKREFLSFLVVVLHVTSRNAFLSVYPVCYNLSSVRVLYENR